jgi:general secretion pathway protein D
MIGFEGQLDIVDSLISTLDVEQQDLRTLRLYDVQNVGADEVVLKLQELGIIGGAGPAARVGARTKIAQPAAKPGPSEAAESLVEEPQVVIIESTNSLLVNATAEQHLQIATIMSYVDSKTLEETIPYVIYPLENQAPETMAAVLNQLVEETVKDKEGKIEKVVKKEEDIIIIPDENTFSLIVYASKKNQEWIRKLITDLDKRRPQVLIDVTLVEINQTDTFNYDLELISSFPDLEATAGIVGGISGTSTSAIMSALASAHRDRFIDTSSKQGTGKGFYADEHIHALLTLMKQKDYGRVLAKPKILVNDNETGSISTAVTTYVARSAQTATPTGETVVATSFTFDPFVSGINLDITPHISEGDLLRLEITMSRSTQSSAGGTNAPPPDKTENKIGTIVTVPDKSTIILGGILTLDQSKNGKKVPILGDIPLVGGLFRTIDNSDIQSKLYIFVKANILRPSEFKPGLPDLEKISERNRMAFEKSEKTFQQYEQWPGLKPEPMEPERVLEAE